MTLRNDWCSTCGEDAGSVHPPASKCSHCGQTLVSRPLSERIRNRSRSNTVPSAPRLSVMPEHILQQVRTTNQELTLLFAELRQQVNVIRTQTVVLQQQTIVQARTDMELLLPPDALDPQQARWTDRGTAKKVLDALPRIDIENKCFVKHCQTDPTTTCNLELKCVVTECIICCETLDIEQRVVQLPICGHFFHEPCALTWLTEHNSCPYCRRLLPTDDAVYEAERRRTGRTHAGSSEMTIRERSLIA